MELQPGPPFNLETKKEFKECLLVNCRTHLPYCQWLLLRSRRTFEEPIKNVTSFCLIYRNVTSILREIVGVLQSWKRGNFVIFTTVVFVGGAKAKEQVSFMSVENSMI
jgi:hypothetical protein